MSKLKWEDHFSLTSFHFCGLDLCCTVLADWRLGIKFSRTFNGYTGLK